MPPTDARDAEFRALADPTRRAILKRLMREEVNAGDISAEFKLTRPAISRHLRVLREANLVLMRREAQMRLYSANVDAIAELKRWFDDFWDDALIRLKTMVELGREEKG